MIYSCSFPRTGNGASFISAPLAFTLNPSIFLFKMAEKNQNSGCLLPVFKFKPHRTKPTVIGTFSSDDDHASENVRKQSVLINKTLALHVRYQLWFISLSAMQCVSNACALVVTAAKFILHCIQVYVFGTVPRFTGAETTSRTSAQIFSGPIRLHSDNWQCRTEKLSVQCQHFGVPCQIFGACKWGLNVFFFLNT